MQMDSADVWKRTGTIIPSLRDEIAVDEISPALTESRCVRVRVTSGSTSAVVFLELAQVQSLIDLLMEALQNCRKNGTTESQGDTEKVEKLICRARKLAALAEYATPGPWIDVPLSTGVCAIRMPYPPKKTWYGAEVVKRDEDAKLMAAAPDMAKLLREMADELERRTSSKSCS